jgi:L-ascorbate metabolism protein UlaG (beta-lactamase superfamily)
MAMSDKAHLRQGRFFNTWSRDPKTLGAVLRWMRTRTPAPWPQWIHNPPNDPIENHVQGNRLRLTMIGHASVLIQVAGVNILTDPVWSDRTSPVQFAGPKRVRAPGLTLDQLPPIDIVLVSHNHYDHLDVPTLKELVRRFDPHIVTPLGNAALIPSTRVTELDWHQSCTAKNISIECEPVQHWSSRWLNDQNKALWSGFTLKTTAGNIYFAGDTGFHDHVFDQARKKHGSFRVALLPIGAYAPRWFMKYQHMDPDEAVQSMKLLNARRALALHHGVWQLTDEPIHEPADKLLAALAEQQLTSDIFRVLEPGQAWNVEDDHDRTT